MSTAAIASEESTVTVYVVPVSGTDGTGGGGGDTRTNVRRTQRTILMIDDGTFAEAMRRGRPA